MSSHTPLISALLFPPAANRASKWSTVTLSRASSHRGGECSCFVLRDLSYRRPEAIDTMAKIGLAQGRPAIADDFPEVRVGLRLADSERAFDLKTEASGFAVYAFEVDDQIVEGFAEVALLKRDTVDRTIIDTGSVAFSQQLR